MKKIKKNKYFISSDRESASEKKGLKSILLLAATLLALIALLCGSIISFAKAVDAAENEDDNKVGPSTEDIALNIEISEEIKLALEEFDNNISEKDALIKEIDEQISNSAGTPEDKLYAEKLYDSKIKLILDKYEMCEQYSSICVEWSEETRALLSDSIAEYEKYLAAYKERLSVNYEVGSPDKSEIFSTSDNIIDFITGQAMLEEIKIYEEALRVKVEELYAVVADGLGVVKYYLTKADGYSQVSAAAYEEFKVASEDAKKYLNDIYSDKDMYNYYLNATAESQQRIAKLIEENSKKYSSLVSGKVEEYLWPLSSEFFYTDYLGKGHESRYEWSSLLGKYINITHSGIDIYTAGSVTDVLASADGVVIYSDYCTVKGYTVAVLHAKGVVTVYSHCSKLNAELGSTVKAGESIALSGISGDADSTMVNLEVFVKGEFVDPADYIELPDVSLSGN